MPITYITYKQATTAALAAMRAAERSGATAEAAYWLGYTWGLRRALLCAAAGSDQEHNARIASADLLVEPFRSQGTGYKHALAYAEGLPAKRKPGRPKTGREPLATVAVRVPAAVRDQIPSTEWLRAAVVRAVAQKNDSWQK